MKFITLTSENGKKIRYNAEHIVSYWASNGKTEVETIKEVETVDESVYQIDALIEELG